MAVSLAFVVTVDCALSAPSRRHPHCTGDPLIFYVAADSRFPDALRHHDISGRLRVFVKADDSVDHITFEQRTGYSVLDVAAVDALAKWKFTKCNVISITFMFTLERPPKKI